MYLMEAEIFAIADNVRVACGRVRGHPTIPDDHYIKTSAIQREYEEDGKRFIQTMNSVYELREEK